MAIKPEDVLSDNQDYTMIDGVKVRKGSIAAVMANAAILESDASAQEKSGAIEAIKELAPALIVLGVHKHVTFKNSQVQQLLDEAAKKHEARRANL